MIEHLVRSDILTRAEAGRISANSSQFSCLCELLASRGTEKRERIMAEIDSFSRGQGNRVGDGGGHLEESRVQQHHKHMYVMGVQSGPDQS